MHFVHLIERQGSHMLVECGGRYAVVETRNGKVYGVRPGRRRGFPQTTHGIERAIGPDGWHDRISARLQFEELACQGEELAERMR